MQYVVPYALNKLGSVVFFWRLGGSDVALVSPVANGLSFLFTALTGVLAFHEHLTARATLGAAAVATGLALCTAATPSQ